MTQVTSGPRASGAAGDNHLAILDPSDTFARRHIGPGPAATQEMLSVVGFESLDAMADAVVPKSIRLPRPLKIGAAKAEFEALEALSGIAAKNVVMRSCIGMGYSDTITPPVILRNVLENPGWYTQYTPYQAEISQGRLEALLNFQTMVADLTALPLANASLLDEATAAAEAMITCWHVAGDETKKTFWVSKWCHPQTISVVKGRAGALGIDVVVGDERTTAPVTDRVFGVLLQYPATDGVIEAEATYTKIAEAAHAAGAQVVFAADLLALALIKAPGELGADVAVGSTQRFGVPMGAGGPHAAYMATKNEHARRMPGRIVGVSKDAQGNVALRLAIQTREQHIRREKATSNICTAQVLPGIMASFYAVYHGPDGLRRIAERVHAYTRAVYNGVMRLGHDAGNGHFFDTLRVKLNGLPASSVIDAARSRGYNLRDFGDGSIGIALDETTTRGDVQTIIESFAGGSTFRVNVDELASGELSILNRQSEFLTHPVFNTYHSETELLRYVWRLQSKDLSLTASMIPLGSCTMKLNATSEMVPVTWEKFARVHPYAPADQTKGYAELFQQLEAWLADVTGFAAVSLQPNAGSQGEYAGLLTIRGYHESRGHGHRNVCLIPTSAHGTNPASAAVAGFKVVPVACDEQGAVNLDDLRRKAKEHENDLGALMVTYPSTHGVFEAQVAEACRIVHEHGGLVYMDGANMNAQVGLTSPGTIGADVCHLNLHKTFCIPHGGGGPGMGPIAVNEKLAAFLPGRPVGDEKAAVAPVSAAPYGSALILTIPWMYIAMMGSAGLTRATQYAILNANYMAKRLEGHYPILFRGPSGLCAHEFILDCRPFEQSAGIKVEDIAKRLMDYGFHAPTMSWPVPGTLMIEPTESEPKAELDRFCEAMISIREEIRAIEAGKMDRADNPLKGAPHTAMAIAAYNWPHKYGREVAAYPVAGLRAFKFWPAVGRVDNPYGDRNLVCTCPPMSSYCA